MASISELSEHDNDFDDTSSIVVSDHDYEDEPYVDPDWKYLYELSNVKNEDMIITLTDLRDDLVFMKNMEATGTFREMALLKEKLKDMMVAAKNRDVEIQKLEEDYSAKFSELCVEKSVLNSELEDLNKLYNNSVLELASTKKQLEECQAKLISSHPSTAQLE